MRVSIVDDERILAGHIARKLEKSGFVVSVYYGYRHFIDSDKSDANLYVVDIALGDGSGFDVIRHLRTVKKVAAPIILISAYGDSQNIIRGLDMGADDYLTKPILPEELVARARAVIRRSAVPSSADSFRLGKLEYCPASGSAKYDGTPIMLTRNERSIIETLLERPNWIVSREELVAKAWGGGRYVEVSDNTINVTLSNLRKKLGPHCRIRAMYNQGYVLECD